MKKEKIQSYLYLIFGIIIVIGILLQISKFPYAYIIFSIGAIGISVVRFKNAKRSDDFRLRRLQNIQAISTLLLLISGYFMYIQKSYWALTVLLSATFDLIVSFRTPDKDSQNHD